MVNLSLCCFTNGATGKCRIQHLVSSTEKWGHLCHRDLKDNLIIRVGFIRRRPRGDGLSGLPPLADRIKAEKTTTPAPLTVATAFKYPANQQQNYPWRKPTYSEMRGYPDGTDKRNNEDQKIRPAIVVTTRPAP